MDLQARQLVEEIHEALDVLFSFIPKLTMSLFGDFGDPKRFPL